VNEKNPREATDNEVFIKIEFAQTIDTTTIDCFQVLGKSAADLTFHLLFRQVNTDPTAQFFEVVILERIWVSSGVDNELQRLPVNCELRVIRAVDRGAITFIFNLRHKPRIELF